MKLAGLYPVLDTLDPITLFAVDNDGFGKMPTAAYARLINEPKEKITRIMQYQIVHGRYNERSLIHGEKIQTLNGNDVRIYKKEDVVKINESSLVDSDIVLSNGIIHTLDALL
jgi:uncharacterized surface protein with fasciclin (FAS1) repeats